MITGVRCFDIFPDNSSTSSHKAWLQSRRQLRHNLETFGNPERYILGKPGLTGTERRVLKAIRDERRQEYVEEVKVSQRSWHTYTDCSGSECLRTVHVAASNALGCWDENTWCCFSNL